MKKQTNAEKILNSTESIYAAVIENYQNSDEMLNSLHFDFDVLINHQLLSLNRL